MIILSFQALYALCITNMLSDTHSLSLAHVDSFHLTQTFADWYQNGSLKRSVDDELDVLQKPVAGSQPLTFTTRFAASMGTQRDALIKRAYKQYWRSPNYNFARIMIVIIQVHLHGLNKICLHVLLFCFLLFM